MKIPNHLSPNLVLINLPLVTYSSLFLVAIDLLLGLFSGFGRSLIWVVDNVVEFVHLCTYFMVNERFISDIFRATFPHNCCRSFAEINSVKCFLL